MGEVVLGLPGNWADDNFEISDHYTTKLGGLPDWPFPESSLGPELRQCKSCRSNLWLIAQVYAPVTTAALKIEERVVYVFGCTNANCGSWRAIRVQKPDKFEEPNSGDSEVSHSTLSVATTSDSKWWDDLYSFAPESDDTEETEDMSMQDLARAFSEAANLASGSVKEGTGRHVETCQKPVSLVPKAREVDRSTLVLPCFYICYQEDKTLSLPVDKARVNIDDDDADRQEELWKEESYEYDKALNADRTYLKFKKKLDACPQQCIRYSFGGKPLLAAGSVVDSRPCDHCGESRQYEMQLMPPLVHFLQEGAIGAQRELLDSWSWMTLMVFTCSKCCFQKSDQEISNRNGWTVVEETVIPQFEQPLTTLQLGYFS
ncbi:hypothetical protein RND81_06G019800 [Saponaria officinalis]|uniref:Programmed cell death protein 2 C-terminal domain-containing protein n=1 Tax=Saponaria officinalis TaxID=3572 RepID=A0AAW1K3D4_SAPOF